MDHDKAVYPRKAVRYRSPPVEMKWGYTNLIRSIILVKKENGAMTEKEISQL